jgi:tripartite-type tricarboxylate transporter receptor subunit TctC
MQIRSMSVLASSRHVIPCVVTSMLPFGKTQKRKVALQRRSMTRSQFNSHTCCVAKLPTLPALSFSEWVGLFAPRGTPRDIIGRLNAAALEVLADPEVRSRFTDLALEAFPRDRQTPEALGALVKADAERWWPIMKELGIRAE